MQLGAELVDVLDVVAGGVGARGAAEALARGAVQAAAQDRREPADLLQPGFLAVGLDQGVALALGKDVLEPVQRAVDLAGAVAAAWAGKTVRRTMWLVTIESSSPSPLKVARARARNTSTCLVL